MPDRTHELKTTRATLETTSTRHLPILNPERRDRARRCAGERHVRDGQTKRKPCEGCRSANPCRNRAAVLVGAILVLAGINLVFVGAVTATADDARISAHRIETTRAFFAAESALEIVIGERASGRDIPIGTVILPGGEALTITTDSGSPDPTPPFSASVTGSAGQATRTLELQFE